jgi:hypothetical protein
MATSPVTVAPSTPQAGRVVDALHACGLTLTAQNISAINSVLHSPGPTGSLSGTSDAIEVAQNQFCCGFTESLIATVSSPGAVATVGYTLAWDVSLQKHVCLVRIPQAASRYLVTMEHPADLGYQHADARELGCVVSIAVLKSLKERPAVLNLIGVAAIERESNWADDHVVGFPDGDRTGIEVPCPFCACKAAYDYAVRTDSLEPTGEITQMRQFGHVILFQMNSDARELYALNVSAGMLLSARFVTGLFSEPDRTIRVGDSVWVVDALVKWSRPEDIEAFGHYPSEGVISEIVQNADGRRDAIFADDGHSVRIPIVGLARKTQKTAAPLAKHLH